MAKERATRSRHPRPGKAMTVENAIAFETNDGNKNEQAQRRGQRKREKEKRMSQGCSVAIPSRRTHPRSA